MKIALFDLDSTLLPIDSDHAWGAFTEQLGWVDSREFAQHNDRFYEQYRQQTLDINEYIHFATTAIRTQGMAAALKAREQFMQEVVQPHILPQARALVNQYLNTGYECVLVTATNDFVTQPIAIELGFPHLIATVLERTAQGELTGHIVGTPSFQGGKVARVEQWLAEKGHNWDTLQDSVFYSDSMNDLPLLDQVSRPVATNPDHQLEALAKERGWSVLRLFE